MTLYLASKSPRRKAILESLGVSYEVLSISVDEFSVESDPILHCKEICTLKFNEAIKAKVLGNFLVADTIVVSDEKIYNELKANYKQISSFYNLALNSNWASDEDIRGIYNLYMKAKNLYYSLGKKFRTQTTLDDFIINLPN